MLRGHRQQLTSFLRCSQLCCPKALPPSLPAGLQHTPRVRPPWLPPQARWLLLLPPQQPRAQCRWPRWPAGARHPSPPARPAGWQTHTRQHTLVHVLSSWHVLLCCAKQACRTADIAKHAMLLLCWRSTTMLPAQTNCLTSTEPNHPPRHICAARTSKSGDALPIAGLTPCPNKRKDTSLSAESAAKKAGTCAIMSSMLTVRCPLACATLCRRRIFCGSRWGGKAARCMVEPCTSMLSTLLVLLRTLRA